MFLLGVLVWVSLSRGSSSGEGVIIQGGLCRETPQNQKIRQYASHWNAFLFSVSFVLILVPYFHEPSMSPFLYCLTISSPESHASFSLIVRSCRYVRYVRSVNILIDAKCLVSTNCLPREKILISTKCLLTTKTLPSA